MSKINHLIRAIRRELSPTIVADLEHIFAEYGDKPAKRIKPVSGKGSRVGKLGIMRLKGSDMEKLRHEVFERDGGLCQLELDADCWGRTAEYRGELAHKRAKRNNGDTLDNVLWACPSCHSKSHNCGGKPVPKKP